MNTLQTIEQMRQSPYIKEKELLNGISSFNFTRKAFWDNHWTAATIKARGLFIDTTNNKVIARGFDKFFAVDERRETELNMLIENFEYPVKAYIKYNGYLGICAGMKREDGSYYLWCASKSTDQGWYAARFEDILRSSLGDRIERFARDLYENNYTALFEVIDPEQDPHIIEYDKPQVILLSIVMNDDMDLDYYSKSDEVVEFYNATWKLPYKERATVLWNAQEVVDWYNEVIAPGYKYNGEYIEGFVLEDLDQHMVKVKTYYYNLWKSFRPVIHKFYKNEEVDYDKWAIKIEKITGYDFEYSEDCMSFFEWLKIIVPAYEKEPTIIQLRHEWENIDREVQILKKIQGTE